MLVLCDSPSAGRDRAGKPASNLKCGHNQEMDTSHQVDDDDDDDDGGEDDEQSQLWPLPVLVGNT